MNRMRVGPTSVYFVPFVCSVVSGRAATVRFVEK